MESRLSQLTEHCAEIVDRWAVTGVRQLRAVGELEDRLTELSDQLASAVAEFRAVNGHPQPALASADPTWPLEGVVRLHNQLRGSSDLVGPGRPPRLVETRAQLPEAAASLSERMETLEQSHAQGTS